MTDRWTAVPASMRAERAWVCWRLEPRKGGGKPTKVPYRADGRLDGRGNPAHASSKDATTWATFEVAAAASSGFDGIGFVLTGEWAAVDVDHPWASPEATAVIERFAGTYCERSPSGNLRVICKGKVARSGKGATDKKFEVYRAPSSRYVTVTGDHIEGTATEVTEQPEAIAWLEATYFAKPGPADKIIERVKADKKWRALFEGAWEGSYASQSEADFAFCIILARLTRDPKLIDAVFRRSGLMDAKRDRPDYRERTIAEALRRVAAETAEAPTAEAPAPPAAEPGPMDPAAFYGILGDIVRKLEPHSEADPAALLVQLLVAAGSAMGREWYFRVENTRHHGNLFAVVCGATANARKGTSWNRVEGVVREADPAWPRYKNGIASGEGIIDAVRDAEFGIDRRGKKVLRRAAVEDKRCLFVEPEFARLLQTCARDGNTTSQVLRAAWDGGDLEITARASPCKSTSPHISLVGHITKDELRDLTVGTSTTNGAYNRFLWVFAKRSKLLPLGGGNVDLQAEIARLASVLKRPMLATAPVEMMLDGAAVETWSRWYAEFADLHPMQARSPAMLLRLAMIFAVFDGVEIIAQAHLEAARAVVEYSNSTVAWLLDDLTASSPESRILDALHLHGQMTGREVSALFSRNLPRVSAHCEELARKGLVEKLKDEAVGKGRPATIWRVAATG